MLPKEKNLEESIENYLVSSGYEQGHSQEFDLQYALFSEDLFRFLEATQKEMIDEFKYNRGANWRKAFLDLVNSNISKRGLIHVLRNGIEDIMMNGTFKLFYLSFYLLTKDIIGEKEIHQWKVRKRHLTFGKRY